MCSSTYVSSSCSLIPSNYSFGDSLHIVQSSLVTQDYSPSTLKDEKCLLGSDIPVFLPVVVISKIHFVTRKVH